MTSLAQTALPDHSHTTRPQADAIRARMLGGWYIVWIACLTVPMAVLRALHPNGWTPGDWLVNYEGGFVRRGLPGEGILLTSRLLHLSPVILGSLAPLALYLLLYLVIWRLYQRADGKIWTLAALFSPATLAFPVLDPVGAFRKELLLLVALGMFLLWFVRRTPRDEPLIAFLTLTGSVAILSHEGLLPYLLYLFGALLIGLHDLRRVLRIAVLPVFAVFGTLLAVVHHRGSELIQQTICRSLGPTPPLVCGGSIAYLAKGTAMARGDVLHDIHAYHYLLYYPVLTLLALLPLAGMARQLWRDHQLRSDLLIVAGTGLVAFSASTPLFFYAMDWGRWIYIHVVSLFLLLLFLDVRKTNQARTEQARQALRPAQPTRAWVRPRWASVALLLYATCWNLPHFGNYPKKGYLNLPLHLLKQRLEHKPSGSAWEDLTR